MKVGIVLPTYRRLASAENIVGAAQLAEDLGFDSVWTTDRVVIPTEQEAELGRVWFDPIATLAFVAGMTRRVELGIAVLVIPYRHPLPVAKELATIDQLSGGRVILGAGLGWLSAEFVALGQDMTKRAGMTEDGLAVMRACWESERPVYHGSYFRVEGVFSAPLPARRIPVWIGGVSEQALSRASRIGDGWISDRQTFEQLEAALALLNRSLEAVGRSRAGFSIALRTLLHIVSAEEAVRSSKAIGGASVAQKGKVARAPFRGGPDEVAADLRRAADMGIDHLIFEFPIARGEESMELFEPLAELRRSAGV